SMNFKIENFYNPHLSLGASRLDTILSITAALGEGGTTTQNNMKKAIIFVLDVSGSMDVYTKIDTAKLAVRKSIDLLDEDNYFAVIAFSNNARVLVPLMSATRGNKEAAHYSVKMLRAGGGTQMSNALLAVLDLISTFGDMMTHVQFVTDGQNDRADHNHLEEALDRCEGMFQCNCWGIGVDWEPQELKNISNRLLGTADAVPNPERLEETFRSAMAKAASKGIGDVRLRIQSPKSIRIVTIKQVSPEIVDLSKLAKRIDERNLDIPLGAWGEENREYQIAFELQPQGDGEEMMAGKPKIVFTENGQETVMEGDRIVAAWSSDVLRTSRINEQVAHYTGQEELAQSIKEGLEAKSRGDIDSATVLLGKAAKIAVQSGNEEVTARLKKVVDIIDADQGTVRLKASAGKAEDLELDMGGTMTIRKRSSKTI
ncbi:MAG: VWA domain-containing protein, partial [Bacillota bacterium]|nr:VWA domain-containing protein [Bacillota bacterium]